MEGNAQKAKGKVLKSTEKDTVFVNFVDHGGPGIVAFPNGPMLHVSDLSKTLKTMQSQKMFSQMVFYMEVSKGNGPRKHVFNGKPWRNATMFWPPYSKKDLHTDIHTCMIICAYVKFSTQLRALIPARDADFADFGAPGLRERVHVPGPGLRQQDPGGDRLQRRGVLLGHLLRRRGHGAKSFFFVRALCVSP